MDLGHGTVRYREDSATNPVIQKQEDVKTGYFYHTRLDDYSEGNLVLGDMLYVNNRFCSGAEAAVLHDIILYSIDYVTYIQ